MKNAVLFVATILAASCADQLQAAKDASRVQRETCDGVSVVTPEQVEAVRAVDEKIADGIERLQELCSKVDAGKVKIKEVAGSVGEVVSE